MQLLLYYESWFFSISAEFIITADYLVSYLSSRQKAEREFLSSSEFLFWGQRQEVTHFQKIIFQISLLRNRSQTHGRSVQPKDRKGPLSLIMVYFPGLVKGLFFSRIILSLTITWTNQHFINREIGNEKQQLDTQLDSPPPPRKKTVPIESMGKET